MTNPEVILQTSIEKGVSKVNKPWLVKWLLGFVGGAMIALGFLADIRVSAAIPASGGSTLIGASVFPIGLIVILLAGGELVTGNMMAVSTAAFAKRLKWPAFWQNLAIITVANVIAAVAVAFFFGHFVGLTHSAVFKTAVITMAQAKIQASFWQSLVSGIGCNWFVGLAVWLSFGAKDAAGKVLGIWFPIMIFVATGFQHSIANAFLIPAAIFEGGATWSQFAMNLVPVYLGNIIGGAIFVGALYYYSYRQALK